MANKFKQWFKHKAYAFLMWALDEYTCSVNKDICRLDAKVSHHHEQTRYSIDELHRTLQMLHLTKIGVDHHIWDKSWAVVCTKDRNGQERVNFYSIDTRGVKELRSILRSFERDDVIIDTQPDLQQFFKW